MILLSSSPISASFILINHIIPHFSANSMPYQANDFKTNGILLCECANISEFAISFCHGSGERPVFC